MNFKDLFHNSYERAVAQDPDAFFTEFYRIFTSKSDDIQKMFNKTDMQKQTASLIVSFMQMLWFADERKSDQQMEELALLHARMGINNKMYDLWMESLLETLKSMDSQYSENDSLAWRVVLSPGITFMKYAGESNR